MIEALRGGKDLGRVLEIGTGCGYQAAVLAQVAKEVYSIERIAGLLERARVNLRPLRLANLRLVHGDGAQGVPEAAPFDAIIVAAAAARPPDALLQQLCVGGRMIAPLGANEQTLCMIERTPAGFSEKWLDAVHFVPLRSGKQ
jgi:protein-L-isoaspartate(D-aspartate) O-methyltransferase